MKQFKRGQEVVVPNGRKGKIQSVSGTEAIVWFDEDGNDTGVFSIPTLQYPVTKLALVNRG